MDVKLHTYLDEIENILNNGNKNDEDMRDYLKAIRESERDEVIIFRLARTPETEVIMVELGEGKHGIEISDKMARCIADNLEIMRTKESDADFKNSIESVIDNLSFHY